MTDYHEFTTIDTPRGERERLGVGDIFINEATCQVCNTTIRSRNRHDFVSCKCGKLSVDGGSWYAKRSFDPGSPFINNIVPFSDARTNDD